MSSTTTSGVAPFLVSSEAGAWDLLRGILNDEIIVRNFRDITFEDWPVITIKVPGERLNSSLTAELAESLVDIQTSLYRAYSTVLHGSPTLRRLTDEEKRNLELIFRIEGGSSNVGAELIKFLTELGTAAVSKLEAKHVVIIVLSVALIYAGTTTLNNWIEVRAQERIAQSHDQQTITMLQSITKLSEIDKENINLLIRTKNEIPELREIDEISDETKRLITKRVSTEPRAIVNGVVIDSDIGKELTKNSPIEPYNTRLDGNYLILKNDTTRPLGFNVRLQNVENEQIVNAEVHTSSTPQDVIEVLRRAEWDKSPVFVKINATLRGDEITYAAIIDAKPISQ